MAGRLKLGDMLVAAGMVTGEQVQEALGAQGKLGLRLGETLVALGHVTEAQMTQVVSNQLTVPWVNLYHVDFSRELLALVPTELAEKYCLIPVYVRHLRREGDTLYVAMDDPLNLSALQEVADRSGLPVKPMVASPTDIRDAIRVYYLGLPPLEDVTLDLGPVHSPSSSSSPLDTTGEVAPRDEAQDRSSAKADDKPADKKPPSDKGPEASEPDLDGDGDGDEASAAVHPSVPPGPRPGPGFLTLTLLDGTRVRLPSGGSRKKEPASAGLTTRDLIHALRARAGGADVSEVLPEGEVETLLATLLAVLLRKGLLADWEFVDEWNKHRRKRESDPG